MKKKRPRPNIVLMSKFTTPIYGNDVWVVVAHDARMALNRMRKRFNCTKEKRDFGAMTVGADTIGVFFWATCLTKEFVGHEIDHVVETILTHHEAATQPKCSSCKEHQALLSGVISDKIYRVFAKHKMEVRL